MPHRKPLISRRWSLDAQCDHRDYPIVVVATEMGYHARCLGCEAAGPGRPSLKAARQALLILGEPTDGRRHV